MRKQSLSIYFFMSILSFSGALFGQKDKSEFDSIKKYLKKDFLEDNAKKVIKKEKIKKVKKKNKLLSKSNYPNENDFWPFFSEYWLVKNAQLIKWDFRKPDYGIQASFKDFLERLGFYHYKFKILIVDTYNLSHMGLPSGKNEYILLLSLPFIRSMDLTKREISLLLFEDILRVDAGLIRKRLINDNLKESLGANFFGKEINNKGLTQSLATLSHFILKDGFSFQEQFNITTKMDKFLSNYSEYKSSYILLLRKIDNLIKTNKLFKSHVRMYPSAEMQLKWLVPGSQRKK